MIIDLTYATLEQLTEIVFSAERVSPPEDATADDTRHFLEYRVDPARQVVLLTDLFRRSSTLTARYSAERIERGLWHVMGAECFDDFTAHIWNPAVSLVDRVRLIESVHGLYDGVLARYPYEPIDFTHPDRLPRRFHTIDYMVPDLLLTGERFMQGEPADRSALRHAFLSLFARLLAHPAPVAQYAGLHGLGHLAHERRSDVIDTFLERHPEISGAQRRYAMRARRGDVL